MKTHSVVDEVESLTQDYGRDIFVRLRPPRPFPLSPRWWDDRLMEWSMVNPALKVQLFRFVDVLPALLGKPAEIVRHLREYFAEAGPDLPRWVHRLLPWLPTRGLLGRTLASTAEASARRMAARFIAGATVEEALRAIASMRRRKLAFTIDLLGEATITEAEAQASQAEYLRLIDGLSAQVNHWPAIDQIDRDDLGPIPRVNVSIKLSALYSQFDGMDLEGTTQAVCARLRPLLQAARQAFVFLNIDMEQNETRPATLHIFKHILEEPEFRDWPHVGIAIQAYLRDTLGDLEDLAGWARRRGTPVQVRLVKGAYWDYETIHARERGWPIPVWTRKAETDANYEACTRFLMEHHQLLRPALASHNIRSLARGLALADRLGVPPGRCEVQMLFGMAEPIKEALVRLGQRVRVYTPYGQPIPGMAYLVRRLLENTADDSFLRASFIEHLPQEQLLMNPLLKDERGTLNDSRNRTASFLPSRSSFENEPLTDFSREESRRAMRSALEIVAGRLGRQYPLVIAGQEVPTAEWIVSVNPSHSKQVVGRCGQASEAQARQAIEAATRAFESWRDTPVQQRAQYLRDAAGVMRQRRFELAAWQVYECGKQWREADADVAEAIDFCQYYAQEMLRLGQPRHRNVPGETNEQFYEPRGLVVVIAPWNFPLAILTGMTVAALVTGNTVIMKPAEQSSVIGGLLMEILRQVGVPDGVVNYLPGLGEQVGPILVNDPRTAMIAFTGSRLVGLHINRQAAEVVPGQTHVKRVLAEMGGKNAIIVDDDADLDEAVEGVTTSAFGYQGQKCSACSRLILLDSIHDQFLARLIEATRSLKVAPAEDPGSIIGPVIEEEARDRLLRVIERGRNEARLVHAGDVGALQEEGYFVAPHIFAEVDPRSFLAQEEFFGPILAVLRARDLEHALEIANGTEYALTGGFYSRSPGNVARVRRQFRVGNLYINRKITGALVDRQPFGGFKLSGIGSKAGGPDYLLQFLLPRTVTENTLRRGFAPEVSED